MIRKFIYITTFLIFSSQYILVHAQTKALTQFANAQRAFEKKNYDVAISFYQKAIEIDPELAEAYFGLGLVYSLKNQLKNSISLYKKAINLKPTFYQAYFALGLVNFLQNNLIDSLVFYEKALVLNPTEAEIYIGLGRVHSKLKKYNRAISYYLKAIPLEPENPDIYYALGLAYDAVEKGEKAINYIEKAKRIYKKEENYLWHGHAENKLKIFNKKYGLLEDNNFEKFFGTKNEQLSKVPYEINSSLGKTAKPTKGLSDNYKHGFDKTNAASKEIPPINDSYPFQKDRESIEILKYKLEKNLASIDSWRKEKQEFEKQLLRENVKLQDEHKSIEKLEIQIENKLGNINTWIKEKKEFERKLLKESTKLQKKLKLIENIKFQIEDKMAKLNSWRKEKRDFEKQLLNETVKIQNERDSIENLKFQIDKKLSKKLFNRNRNVISQNFKKNEGLASIGNLEKGPTESFNIKGEKLTRAGLIQQQGKGFLFSLKNYVITSSQLIKKAQTIKIKLITGEKIKADVLIDDAQNGIAILKPARNLLLTKSSLIIGNSSKLQIGHKIFAIDSIGSIPTYTEGFIKNLNGSDGDSSVFQYSMEAYPINSGAPIFNSRGEVIGITKKTIDLKTENKNLKTIPKIENYAVKSNHLSKLLALLPRIKVPLNVSTLESRSNYDVANFLNDIKRAIVQIEVNKRS